MAYHDGSSVKTVNHEGNRSEEDLLAFLTSVVEKARGAPKKKAGSSGGVHAKLSVADMPEPAVPSGAPVGPLEPMEPLGKPDIGTNGMSADDHAVHGPIPKPADGSDAKEGGTGTVDYDALRPASTGGFARSGPGVPFQEA